MRLDIIMDTAKTRRLFLEQQRLAERENRTQGGQTPSGPLWAEPDFPTEHIVRHLDTNPIGKLLELIAALPDVRYDKIEHARRQLSLSEEALDARLDIALDRILEEITTEI